MMCPKCGMQLAEKSDTDMEVSAKDAVLEDLIKMLEGSAGAKLGKPKAIALEMVTEKPMGKPYKEDDEEEEA